VEVAFACAMSENMIESVTLAHMRYWQKD